MCCYPTRLLVRCECGNRTSDLFVLFTLYQRFDPLSMILSQKVLETNTAKPFASMEQEDRQKATCINRTGGFASLPDTYRFRFHG